MHERIEWFAWEPLRQRITLAAHLTPEQGRSALALALAHRALGHWGNELAQDVEARNLAASWLIGDAEVAACGGSTYALAARCGVIEVVALIRLGLVCDEVSNAELPRLAEHKDCPCAAASNG